MPGDLAAPPLKRPRLGAAPTNPDQAVATASADTEEPVLRRPKFGARYLTENDDVYEHNAWDDVEWSEEMEKEAQSKVETNSRVLVSEELRVKYEDDAADYWDKFYSNHNNKFFKDRHWLLTEFPELARLANVTSNPSEGKASETVGTDDLERSTEKQTVFEIGCGVGNTMFPIVSANSNANLHVYAADYSAVAVDILKSHNQYDSTKCTAFVCDISSDSALEGCPIAKGSVDIITLIFVLSAISPDRMIVAARNITSLLKPGGCVLFRDYGRYDLAQTRFKSGHAIEDNFYARGDGTRVYFFTLDELGDIFTGCGLVAEETKYDRRMIVNRSRKLQMFRIWTQCVYRKPAATSE